MRYNVASVRKIGIRKLRNALENQRTFTRACRAAGFVCGDSTVANEESYLQLLEDEDSRRWHASSR